MVQVPEIFGNYAIKGIEEIHFPDPVSWLPQTVGWSVLAALLLIGLGYACTRLVRRWHRDRYRRAAIAQLAELERLAATDTAASLASVPEVLKGTALQAYPRTDVAALTGDAWLSFLDAHYDGPSFSNDVGRLLPQIAYAPKETWPADADAARELIAQVRHWVRGHKGADP